MEIQNFFSKLWERKAESEKGHEIEEDIQESLLSPEIEYKKYDETKEVDLYKQIEKQAVFDDNTKELFCQITRGILDYYKTMSELERVTISDGTNEEISKSDQARRFAHNALIDNLNALSRYTGKMGLDNEWRSVIGLERTQVTEWVKRVAPFLILKEEKQ